MEMPICETCLSSETLCNACKNKLDLNEITQTEIDVSKFVNELSGSIKSLQDVKIEKVIDSNIFIIISGKGDGAKLVGKGGSVVKALAKKFGKGIKIIENINEFRPFIESLVSPAVVNGINTIYSQNGEKLKIRIPSSFKSNMVVSIEDVINISESMFDKKVEVVFD
ncbi:MAG: hypothetical protein PHU12_02440 [Candidatus Aenigmarchaeota archaeon]|nr:hypothetical protein [Candidatus Aenigmarchaeota archaeon]